jgi:hypothetical protein
LPGFCISFFFVQLTPGIYFVDQQSEIQKALLLFLYSMVGRLQGPNAVMSQKINGETSV